MKKLLLTLLCFGASCAYASTSLIFNDSWADGGYTDGADANDIAWYGTTGSSALDSNSYTSTVNLLSARSGSSGRGFHGVFASQSIANTGDKIMVTYSFTTPATVLEKTSALRVGFFNSNDATAQNSNNDSEGNPRAVVGDPIHTQSSLGSTDDGWDTVYGEMVDLDANFTGGTSNFGFKSKTSSVATGRLMNSTTGWTSQGSNVDGAYTIAANKSYVGTFSIENKGGDLYDLSASISFEGTEIASETREGKTIAANTFDIIAFNHSSNAFGSTNSGGVADNGIDYTNIQVSFTQVPEPSAYALLLGGVAVVIAVARRKQRV
mgnify:CR=1 FL=1